QFNETRISELLQEADVVFEEVIQAAHAVTDGRDAVDAEAEGVAGVAFGVVTRVFEDARVDHTAAEDLDPAGVFAEPAPRAGACRAGDIHLGGGLGEGEVMWPEAELNLGTEEAVHEEE